MDFKSFGRVFTFLFVLSSLMLSVACDTQQSTQPTTTLVPAKGDSPPSVELDAKDRGFGYIPLNINGSASDYVPTILAALQKFEMEHQDLYITNWHVERRQSAYATSSFVYGIWISYARIPPR